MEHLNLHRRHRREKKRQWEREAGRRKKPHMGKWGRGKREMQVEKKKKKG